MRIGNMMQILFFIGFLITGSILTLFVHRTPASSETENRRLASFPLYSLRNVMSGVFFRELDNYTADHIGFREPLIHSSTFLTSLQGIAGRESALIVPSHANNTGESQSAPQVLSTSNSGPTEPPTSPLLVPEQATPSSQPAVSEEKGKVQGKILILEDRAVNLFSYDPAAGQAYADEIHRIQERIDQLMPDSVHTSVILAPTAAEFLQSAKLRSLSDSQKNAIDEVYGKIKTKIAKVDAVSSLSPHTGEPLFFRTDHHWTASGAYYAYAALVQAKGMDPVPLTAYQTGEAPDFLGSFYTSTMNRQLAAHPDTVVYYKPNVSHRYVVHYSGPLEMPLLDLSHASKKNKYRIFLSGDRPWSQITTQSDNQRSLLVIKDSYGNALVPFLLPHYREIYVVDPRQFDQPIVPFIQQHHIQEVLFINNAEVLMDQGFAQLLRKLVRE
ncbi:DHHW family protein [Paenibacillus sp. HJGM_3]|uniref:DHHW family protein n=1 Tax=Paenibacillus sp. HJGM_3 TaxID=3379816 RepID=UPI00385AC103